MTDDQLRGHLRVIEETLLKASKANAAAAAKKVIAEASRASQEVREEFVKHIERIDADYQESKADRAKIRQALTDANKKLDFFGEALIGLQNTKLFQQGITALALALVIVLGWKAVGG